MIVILLGKLSAGWLLGVWGEFLVPAPDFLAFHRPVSKKFYRHS